jgi:hypothetical protein
MALFDKEIMDKAEAMSSSWLKGTDFENGLTLKITHTEKIKSQYGAKAEDSMVEKNILEEGETFRYLFEDAQGVAKKHDSSSMPFFIAMQQVEMNYGDWLFIKREGKGDRTRYTAEIVDAPVVSTQPEIEEIDPASIPF